MLSSGDSPNLDLLRSVAVLAVLADHIAGTFHFAQRHLFFWALGRWGVLLFFVHTSLVLMMSMERLRLNGLQLHVTFYIRRFFRIYPLSIFVVGLVLLAHIPITSWAPAYNYPDRGTIYSNFLLCQNLLNRYSLIGPLWSLPYEVQMYLLLPAVFLFVRRTRTLPLIALWCGAVLLGLLQAWLANTYPALLFDRLGIAEYVPCFLLGVIAYYIIRRQPQPRIPFWAWPITLCVVGVAYLVWNAKVGFVGYPEWICCLPIGMVVANCVESRYRILNRLTHWVAKYSYGLYLGQVPVLWLVFVKLKHLPAFVQWPLFLFLIVGVPVASYHLLEHPFVKLGASIAAWEQRRREVRSSRSATEPLVSPVTPDSEDVAEVPPAN